MKSFIKTATLTIFLITATTLYSSEYFVDTSVKENGSGTKEKPFKTLSNALKAAFKMNDVIYIKGTGDTLTGEYNIDAAGIKVLVHDKTWGNGTVVINGKGKGTAFTIDAPAVTLKGFTIINYETCFRFTKGNRDLSSIIGNSLLNSKSSAIVINSIRGDLEISNNSFTNNFSCIKITGGYPDSYYTIYNNDFSNSESDFEVSWENPYEIEGAGEKLYDVWVENNFQAGSAVPLDPRLDMVVNRDTLFIYNNVSAARQVNLSGVRIKQTIPQWK